MSDEVEVVVDETLDEGVDACSVEERGVRQVGVVDAACCICAFDVVGDETPAEIAGSKALA